MEAAVVLAVDFIRHSDGGVSERFQHSARRAEHFIRHSDGGVSEQRWLRR